MNISLKFNLILGSVHLPVEENINQWPPLDNFPITIDQMGKTVSYFGDSKWKFTSVRGRIVNIYFRSDDTHPTFIDEVNTMNLKTILAWWLWRSITPISVDSIKAKASFLFQVFKDCSGANIDAKELYKYPHMIEKLQFKSGSYLKKVLPLLHMIYENRASIGFYILNPVNIEKIYASVVIPETKQTPYIPPRIWKYQVSRLNEFVLDYHEVKTGIRDLYQECLNLYLNYFGSWERAYAPISERGRRSTPFDYNRDGVRFEDLARKHGVEKTLQKWLYGPGLSLMGPGKGLNSLNRYLGMASRVGIAYILNFTAMRIDEAWNLRSDCLTKENDPDFGDFWTITGETTKLYLDSDARWITSPSVEPSVRMMVHVAELRETAAKVCPYLDAKHDAADTLYLISRPYEPWGISLGKDLPNISHYNSYASVIDLNDLLFDSNQVSITAQDISIARLITPSLDGKKYQVGNRWPFAWHQLRRTGAVNMQASGLVSDSSLQYALKHQSRIQSLYYAQGFSKLIFNEDGRSEYIKAAYETRAVKLARLVGKRFASPYGQKRQDMLLAPINQGNFKKLLEAAKTGRVGFREVLLGVCLNKEHCTKGGIDNIVYCGGGHGKGACTDLLIDKTKLIQVKQLKAETELLLETAPNNTPYHTALSAQIKAAQNAISIIEAD